jgi:hypothetical protein
MLLVIGGQAERVEVGSDLMTVDLFKHEDLAITKDFSRFASAFSQSDTTHSPVCNDKEGQEKVKDNFKKARKQLTDLSSQIQENCGKQVCLGLWYSLSKQIKAFRSCGTSTMVDAQSVSDTLLKVQKDVVAVMRRAVRSHPRILAGSKLRTSMRHRQYAPMDNTKAPWTRQKPRSLEKVVTRKSTSRKN